MNVNEINAAVLAYIGDAIYEVEIRNYLINNNKPNISFNSYFVIHFASER